ncbi:cytochrome P450 9e2-like [Lasioglossum baleicum]|uniref:cytochrome P450 9e2-like n=1 Tax=Lasioglossum baleicum TaxID=434251 RepID=UPI003FCD001B
MSDRRYDFSRARESVPKGSPTNYNQNRSDKNSAEMDPVTTALAVGLLCLLAYRFLSISTTSFGKRGVEYTKPWPIVGNMAPVLFRRQFIGDYIRNVYFKFPDLKYFGFYNLVAPIIVIRDPELITSIAVKNFDHFTDHVGFVNEEMDPLMGKNLFALRGDRWREMRKLLSPAFTAAKMKSMFKLIIDCAEKTSAFIAEESKKGRDWDMQDIFKRYANDVVATTSFGIAVDSLKDPDNEFYKLGRESISFSTWVSVKMMMGRNFPTISRLLGIKLFGSKPREFFTKIVAETTRMREEKGIHRPDMIQLMMDSRDKDGKRLTVDEMTNQAFVFFLGGFDTTSTMMCLVGQVIATNPEIRSKVLLEVEEAHRKMAEGQPTYDVIRDMAYLDAVIDETLRIYPIASFLDRICVKEFELPPAKPGAKSVTVKPGESLWFLPNGLHHDPKYYKDAENFRPERFLNGEVSPNTYMPFGVGPRVCIANRFAMMEAKILFYHLLRNCVIEPCEKTTVPLKFSEKSFAVVPPTGYWLNIRTKEDESVANGHVANDSVA